MGYVKKYKQNLVNNELKDTLFILVYYEGYSDRELQKKINNEVRELDFVQKYEKEKDLIFGKRWLFNDMNDFYLSATGKDLNSFETFEEDAKRYINKEITENEQLLIEKFKISKFRFYTYNSIKEEIKFIGEYIGDLADTSDTER